LALVAELPLASGGVAVYGLGGREGGGRPRRGSGGHPRGWLSGPLSARRPGQGLCAEEVAGADDRAVKRRGIDSALDADGVGVDLLGTFREQRHGLPFPRCRWA